MITIDEAAALPRLLTRSVPRCSVCRAELDWYEAHRPTWTVLTPANPLCSPCYVAAQIRRDQDRAEGPLPSAAQVLARLQASTRSRP